MRRVLVIGGGAAGLAASIELASRGIASTVVEQEPFPGGLATHLSCKGAPRCLRCDACYPHDLRSEAARTPLVTIMASSRIVKIKEVGEGFLAEVRTPHGTERVDATAVIMATGARPYDPDNDPRLHHHDCPDVLSSLEVERTLVEKGRLTVPSTGAPPREIAIIQCVGSRDVRRGKSYCSKACCKYALKLGRHLRSLDPQVRLTFFFMDWRPLEDPPNALHEWASGDENVRVVRCRPSEILPADRPIVRYAPPGEFVVEEAFDLVMLSVGLVPDERNFGLASSLGLRTDEFGFMVSGRKNVFLAGTCQGPKDLRESAEEGVAAAGLASRLLEGSG